jgi:hypothetical protein
MLLFADGNDFWTVKTAIDWIAVVGLFLTFFSIWLSWWLARRDLKTRIAQAQQETVARLTATLLQSDVVETARCLEQAREAGRAKNWGRAIDRCEQAMQRIPRFRPLPGLDDSDRQLLDEAVSAGRGCG